MVEAYRDGFHLHQAPDLSEERLALFALQKNFQLAHGLLDRDVDLDAWVERAPSEEAHERLQAKQPVAA